MTESHIGDREELFDIIDELAEAAKENLTIKRNLEKGSWEDSRNKDLVSRAMQELIEFQHSVGTDVEPPDGEDTVKEGGDVLNFMAMVIHNGRRKE